MRAIFPVRSSEIAVHPFAGVVVVVAAVIAGLKFANWPIAAPMVVVPNVTLIPSKCGSDAAAAVIAFAALPGDSTVRMRGPAFTGAITGIGPAATAAWIAPESVTWGP